MPAGAFRKKKTSFAQVSNIALRDENLSLKAKGLLSLIESYISLDNFVLYKQFLINKSKDGETAFRGAWKELKDNGYLIQYKLRDEESKQFYYEYEVCDNPHVENQRVAHTPTSPYVENPLVDSPPVEFPHGSLPIQWETHSYNKSLSNNNINNNTLYTNIIRNNIDYDPVFVSSSNKELVDNIVDIMVDILANNYKSIKINNGEINSEHLKTILLKVNMNHINYTIDAINNYKTKITNMRNFVLSVLYNSVLTLDIHYQNLVSM